MLGAPLVTGDESVCRDPRESPGISVVVGVFASRQLTPFRCPGSAVRECKLLPDGGTTAGCSKQYER